jgi:Ca2+:H+ antiporter
MAKSRLSPRHVLYAMLAFGPASLVLRWTSEAAVWTFACACLAIIPLAWLMGQATEVLASRVGAGLGAFLNASLGNAAELIIALIAISQGKADIVKASLTGSIIGNILFVLGLAMVAGGARRDHQEFNPTAASAGSTLLILSVLGLLVPTLFDALVPEAVERSPKVIEVMSLVIAGVLLLLYGLYLLFSLRTHKHLYDGELDDSPRVGWSARRALVVLIGAAASIGILSEILVGSLEETIADLGFTQTFVGVVILAVVGNAAEHSTAVQMAMRDRITVSIQIAIESSNQIALFVAPVCVFAGLLLGQPMDLHFTTFEVLAVTASAFLVQHIAQDGKANWFEGSALLAVYAMLATAFFFVP